MSKNEIHDNDLDQVSGGAIAPDELWYGVKTGRTPYGSDEFKKTCERLGVDPSISMEAIEARQERQNQLNIRRSNSLF